MGGTGLEPVTPSLSSIFEDGDVSIAFPIFAAQKPFPHFALGLVMRTEFESFVRSLCVDGAVTSSSDWAALPAS